MATRSFESCEIHAVIEDVTDVASAQFSLNLASDIVVLKMSVYSNPFEWSAVSVVRINFMWFCCKDAGSSVERTRDRLMAVKTGKFAVGRRSLSLEV